MTSHESGTATFKAFAQLLGERSPSYVTQLKDAGRLVLTANGKRVRVQESLTLIRETADPARSGVAARHASARQPPTTEVEDPVDTPSGDGVQDSHARRRSKALADKAETDAKTADLDYRARIGQLLEAEEVEHATRSAVTVFRATLENLPSTLAPELAAISDEGRLRVVLSEAMEHALEELARKFSAIAREREA